MKEKGSNPENIIENIMKSGPIRSIYVDGELLKVKEEYNYIEFLGKGGFGLIFKI